MRAAMTAQRGAATTAERAVATTAERGAATTAERAAAMMAGWTCSEGDGPGLLVWAEFQMHFHVRLRSQPVNEARIVFPLPHSVYGRLVKHPRRRGPANGDVLDDALR